MGREESGFYAFLSDFGVCIITLIIAFIFSLFFLSSFSTNFLFHSIPKWLQPQDYKMLEIQHSPSTDQSFTIS